MKMSARWLIPRSFLAALIAALFLYLDYGPWQTFLGDSKWVWCSACYTTLVLCMGAHVIRNYNDKYITRRTLVLMSIQLLPNFLLANFILQDWRAGRLIMPWPLAGPDHFIGKGFISISAFKIDLFLYSLIFFALLALAVYKFGRRVQCSWICTYGALAETVGDPWRDLRPAGRAYSRWEYISVIILAVALVITFWYSFEIWRLGGIEGIRNGLPEIPLSEELPIRLYQAVVGISLMSILAYSTYPLLGGRIWCRFFCPAGRLFRWIGDRGEAVIAGSKEICIECGKCTHMCEMGIDVHEYIQSDRSIPQGICWVAAYALLSAPKRTCTLPKNEYPLMDALKSV
jgi:NAD-dependent dihydropyrimidine dehydrogenase PreA subunit